ncbi:MAG: hypothetical protein JRC92_04385 [Deltaproteobacteria bacterium]|nr:hypothetical protein [Deltaproteobacteria bacterium]
MKRRPDLILKTQASAEQGHGHVRRCQALAAEARRQGLRPCFEAVDQYTADLVAALGEEVEDESNQRHASFIIRDFPGNNPTASVRREVAAGSVVLLLDDHGPARNQATIVTDAFSTPEDGPLPSGQGVDYLYGLDYAPLRADFAARQGQARPGRNSCRRLMVCFGGRDACSITPRLIAGLHRAGYRGPSTIIAEARHQADLAALTADWKGTRVLTGVDEVAQGMLQCDLVVTKMGLLLVEAFCLGLGCALIEPSQAHLDLEAAQRRWRKAWPVREFGLAGEVDFDQAGAKAAALLANPEALAQMGAEAAGLVDGLGASRLIEAMLDRTGRGGAFERQNRKVPVVRRPPERRGLDPFFRRRHRPLPQLRPRLSGSSPFISRP